MSLLDTGQTLAVQASLRANTIEQPGFLNTLGLNAATSFEEGFAAPVILKSLINPTTHNSQQAQGVKALIDATQHYVDNGSSVAAFLGNMVGVITNPLNVMTDAGASLLATGATRGLLATGLGRSLSNVAMSRISTAANAGFVGAASYLPQSVVENYNAKHQRIHWAGVAETSATLGGLSLLIPAIPFAYRLLKNRMGKLAPEEESVVDAVEKEAPSDSKEQAKTQDNAQTIINRYRPDIEIESNKVRYDIIQPHQMTNLQAAMAHALNASDGVSVHTELPKILLETNVSELLKDSDKVKGLEAFADYQQAVIKDRNTLAKQYHQDLIQQVDNNPLKAHHYRLLTDKGRLAPQYFKSPAYKRLLEDAKHSSAARALLSHLHYLQETERQKGVLRTADYLLSKAQPIKSPAQQIKEVNDVLQSQPSNTTPAGSSPEANTTATASSPEANTTPTITEVLEHFPQERDKEVQALYEKVKASLQKAKHFEEDEETWQQLFQCVRGAFNG